MLSKGDRLGPSELGLLAAAGYTKVLELGWDGWWGGGGWGNGTSGVHIYFLGACYCRHKCSEVQL